MLIYLLNVSYKTDYWVFKRCLECHWLAPSNIWQKSQLQQNMCKQTANGYESR